MSSTPNLSVKRRLARGERCVGTWMTLAHTASAEILARAGFDFVVVDLQHSAIGIAESLRLIQVIDLAGCAPLVRCTSNDPAQIQRVLDAGAVGIIIPNVMSAADAEAAVRAAKYPPVGQRGVGLSRAQGYGPGFQEYFRSSNDAVLVVVQIEHKDAVERAHDILAVPGVDAYCLGPYDMSGSFGIAGTLDHPIMQEAERKVLAAAKAAGVAPGLHLVHPSAEAFARKAQEGYRFIAYGVDILFLGDAAREAARHHREAPR